MALTQAEYGELADINREQIIALRREFGEHTGETLGTEESTASGVTSELTRI
jgi:hypothetical protein